MSSDTMTIEQLLIELSDPYTKEDYLKEKQEVEKLILEKYGVKPEDIEEVMKEHRIPHCDDGLVDRWISNEAFRPHLD